MSWETRKGGGLYYTRSFRRNGRMVREYVGGGLVGEQAARQDELRREKRRQEREARQKERAELAAMSQVLATLAALSEAKMREGLETRGYHYHKGEWRKRRPNEVRAMSKKLPEPVDVPPEVKPAWEEIIDSARKGHEGSGEALVKLLDQYPGLVGVHGDLTAFAVDHLLKMTTGNNVLYRETSARFLVNMRQRLAQPGDGELERLVIDRVILSWHALCFVEGSRAARYCEGITRADIAFWDRRVSSHQGDFLKACRALGDLRRLAMPTVIAQMNIADKQQINISAGGQPIESENAG